jgi:hypothetical protein
MIVCVGRGDISAHGLPTDNKGNGFSQLGVAHPYTLFAFSGTACYVTANMRGGAGHVVTAPNSPASPTDEATLVAVEVLNGTRVQDVRWNEDLTNPNSALSVTTTGPATLVAVWWGDAGVGPHQASPDNGFTVVEALLDSGNLVQVAVATKTVAAAGTYTVNWTSNNQGAQLWLVAIEP